MAERWMSSQSHLTCTRVVAMTVCTACLEHCYVNVVHSTAAYVIMCT